jgi:hypothetical protein
MRLSTFQLAARLETDPGQAWMAAITLDVDTAQRLGRELAEELEAFGHATEVIEPTAAAEVVAALMGDKHCVILADALDAAAWGALDRARSRLEHGGTERLVFVMSEAARVRAATHAPNVWSFLASAVYALGDDEPMSVDEREARLVALREAYGLTDEQVVEKFQHGTAPASPDVAEWLVLIGRGDLLERGEP